MSLWSDGKILDVHVGDLGSNPGRYIYTCSFICRVQLLKSINPKIKAIIRSVYCALFHLISHAMFRLFHVSLQSLQMKSDCMGIALTVVLTINVIYFITFLIAFFFAFDV